MTEALLYVPILGLTAALPWLSLLLFVLVSPWYVLGEWMGTDVRLGWSIALAMRAALVFDDPPRRVLPPATVTAAVAFLVLSYIRLHFGTAELPPDDLTGAYITLVCFLAGACAVYSVLKLANSPRRLAVLAATAASAVILSAGFGLLQAGLGYGNDVASGRISGTLGNPNFSSAYLSLGATLAIIAWKLRIGGRRLQLLAAAVAVPACVLTFSRMGIVACFFGLGLAFHLRRRGPVFQWKRMALVLGIGMLAAILGFTYFAKARKAVSSDEPVEQLAQFSQAINDWSRLEAAEYALREWTAHPVWGVGVATLAARNYIVNGIYVTTHDTYVEILSGSGITGAALCGLALFSLLSVVPGTGRRYLLPAAANLGVCCFFADFLGSIEIFVLMAILLAMLRRDPAGSPAGGSPAAGVAEPSYLEAGAPAVAV
jgi:hypothetical protein